MANNDHKSALTLKDWISLTFSSIALVVSLITAYLNTIRQIDDVRLVLGELPFIWQKKKHVVITGHQELTLINSGNRSAAITRAALLVVRPLTGARATDCDFDTVRVVFSIDYDFDPLVLKAGEIVVRRALLPRDKGAGVFRELKQGGAQDFRSVTGGDAIAIDEIVRVCLLFSVATPDGLTSLILKTLHDVQMMADPTDRYPYSNQVLVPGRAVVLLKRSGTIFDP